MELAEQLRRWATIVGNPDGIVDDHVPLSIDEARRLAAVLDEAADRIDR